jgi:hypothetical protein
MGFERVALFGLIDLELETTGAATLTLSTDLPSNGMTVKETKSIAATGRRVVRFRLRGTTKGRLYSVKVTPAFGAVLRLYGGRIWARVLPNSEWAWYQIPIPETPVEWTPVKLPIPETPQEWTAVKLPIPETPETWTPVKLPIPPTPEEWTAVQLPIKPTPANPEWVELETDA